MKLLAFRKSKNMTQVELAKELGVNQSNITDWENGVKIPRVEFMQKIVAYTNGEVQPNDFYYEGDIENGRASI